MCDDSICSLDIRDFTPSYCLYNRDASSTSTLIMSGTLGESLFPVIVGWAMEKYGYASFPAIIVGLTFLLVICYFLAHSVGTGLLHTLLHDRLIRLQSQEKSLELTPLVVKK